MHILYPLEQYTSSLVKKQKTCICRLKSTNEEKASKSYPTKKPPKCNSRTERTIIPNSPDNIARTRRRGERSDAHDAPTIEDLRRTTFSENTLRKRNTHDYVFVCVKQEREDYTARKLSPDKI